MEECIRVGLFGMGAGMVLMVLMYRLRWRTNAMGLTYTVFEDKVWPDMWRVEAVGGEGECYVTIFSGPNAEQRARDYARTVQP